VAHLPLVADAVWREQPIFIRYRSWKGEKERRVEPLGIVQKGGAWYLVGQVEGSARTYRISRILELKVLDEQFARPEPFDLERYWTDSTHRLDAELYPNKATLRISLWGAKMMESILPFHVRSEAEIGEPDESGWRVVTLPVAPMRWAPYELLRFGAEAEVLGPPELRARMAEVAGSLGNLYRYSNSS
jgi:predicted DNA-binding transcriptional regulator YafY